MIETAIDEALESRQKMYEYQLVVEIISKIIERDDLEIFLNHFEIFGNSNDKVTNLFSAHEEWSNYVEEVRKHWRLQNKKVFEIYEVNSNLPFYISVVYEDETPANIWLFSYLKECNDCEEGVEKRLQQIKTAIIKIAGFVQSLHLETREHSVLLMPKLLNFDIGYETKNVFCIHAELTQNYLLEQGQMVNQYRILERIRAKEEEKKTTKIYKACDTKLNRIVVLKTIEKNAMEPAPTEREWEIYEEELQKMAKLSHKNIVKIYEVKNTEHIFYIIMEYIESAPSHITTNALFMGGNNTSPYIKKVARSLEPKKDISIFIEIANALHFLHTNRLLHMCVTPYNIMITREKVPKLMDFNIFHVLGRFNKHISSEALMFVAPEQIKGKPSLQSDIYSLGATLYTIWSDSYIFENNSTNKLMKNIKKGRFQPLSDIDEKMEAICYKCLETEAKKRYQSAKELAHDLENYQNNEDIIAEYISKENKKQRRKKNSYNFKIYCFFAMCLWIASCILFCAGFYFINIRPSFLEILYPCLIMLGVIYLGFHAFNSQE